MICNRIRSIILLFLIVILLFPVAVYSAIYMDEDFEDAEPFVDRKFPVIDGSSQPVEPLLMGINLRAFSQEQTVPPVLMNDLAGTVVTTRAFEGKRSYRLTSGQKLSVTPGKFPYRIGMWFRLWQFAVSTDLVTAKLPPKTQVGSFKIDYSNDSNTVLTPDVSIRLVLRVNTDNGVDLLYVNKQDTVLGTLTGEEDSWLLVTLIAMNKVTKGSRYDTSLDWVAYDPFTKVFKGPCPSDSDKSSNIPISTGIHIYVNGSDNRNIILRRASELGFNWGNEEDDDPKTSEIGWEFAAENHGIIYLDNLYWETRGAPNLDNGIDLEQNARITRFGESTDFNSSQSEKSKITDSSFPFTSLQSTVPGAGSSSLSPSSETKTPIKPDVTQSRIVWYQDYQESVKAGQTGRKCIILFFHSTSSTLSRNMEKLLNEPSVKTILDQYYVGCRLIMNQNPQVCDYYKIFKAPTLVFLDSKGYSRAKIEDMVTSAQLLAELERYKQ